MPDAQPIELIYSLIGYPSETEWLEFKESNSSPEQIARDISALANSAAYVGREAAYKIWGVNDSTRQLVGTSFNPLRAKAKGNQDLLIWLRGMLSPNAIYDFAQFDYQEMHFVVLTIQAASGQPVTFRGVAQIREGSCTTALASGSAREAELWRRLQRTQFEERIAASDLLGSDVFDLLDVDAYFELNRLRRATNTDSALIPLVEQGLVKRQDNGRFSVTNLGALVVARDLTDFSPLRKRTLRIMRFAGPDRLDLLDKQEFKEGYALSIGRAESYIMQVTPSREELDGVFRRVKHDYPKRAVRELTANMAIHQDLAATDSGPLVQMFNNRIEFGNPGASLIKPDRMLNAQPKTRNESLASLLRQMDICEESGSGWDLIIAACESEHILPPHIESDDDNGTVVTLWAPRGFYQMSRRERLEATYWHVCLLYARRDAASNQSLRERFGLHDDRKSTLAISRIVREAREEGLIKIEDESAGTKMRRYIPSWA